MSWDETKLHFPEGYAPVGKKVRACCHCGWFTTPRVSRERAREALMVEHGYTGGGTRATECGICGETVKAHASDLRWTELRYPWEVFQPLQDGDREIYVCRDADACHDRYETNRRADLLKCGCYQSSVMAIGHTTTTRPARRRPGGDDAYRGKDPRRTAGRTAVTHR